MITVIFRSREFPEFKFEPEANFELAERLIAVFLAILNAPEQYPTVTK